MEAVLIDGDESAGSATPVDRGSRLVGYGLAELAVEVVELRASRRHAGRRVG